MAVQVCDDKFPAAAAKVRHMIRGSLMTGAGGEDSGVLDLRTLCAIAQYRAPASVGALPGRGHRRLWRTTTHPNRTRPHMWKHPAAAAFPEARALSATAVGGSAWIGFCPGGNALQRRPGIGRGRSPRRPLDIALSQVRHFSSVRLRRGRSCASFRFADAEQRLAATGGSVRCCRRACLRGCAPLVRGGLG